ncbi:MAG TPA: ABC transporter permease [Candidatus Acidoferrales bacterium]|nr:ABC transporter permease [Candidatus Acidoferrales bacterium]
MSILRRITNLFHRSKLDQDIDAELRAHIEMRAADNIAAGMSPEEARRQAVLRFGSRPAMKERVIAADAHMFLDSLWQDLCYAFRMLRKSPSFTAVAVLTLALGIGATTGIFSVVNAVLVRALPFHDPARLVSLFQRPIRMTGLMGWAADGPDILDWQRDAHSLSGVSASLMDAANITGGSVPQHVSGAKVTANYFDLFGVHAALGRTFSRDDEHSAQNEVVLSYSLWRTSFGGQDVVGRSIELDRQPFTIIGVMPAIYHDPRTWGNPKSNYWILLPQSQLAANRGEHMYASFGRLAPNVTLAQANRELDLIAARDAKEFPGSNEGMGARVSPLEQVNLQTFTEGDFHSVSPAILLLQFAAGFLLLIACANVANLMLSQSLTRHHEFALRAALGAGRTRIIRQLLTESVLLSLAAGTLGVLLAIWCAKVLLALAPEGYLPATANIRIDLQALAFTVCIATLTGILFGLLPALRASRRNLNEDLKTTSSGSGDSVPRMRARYTLVIFELAATFVLLIGGGLMVRSLNSLLAVNPGFQPRNFLTAAMSLPAQQYAKPEQIQQFFLAVQQRVEALPGVDAIAFTSSPEFAVTNASNVILEGQTPSKNGTAGVWPQICIVTPNFFRAAGIEFLQGRAFSRTDLFANQPVAIVSQSFAAHFWPHQNPLGKRLACCGLGDWASVVGVVGDVHQEGLAAESRPELYFPLTRGMANGQNAMNVVVRSSMPAAPLTRQITEHVAAVDNGIPLSDVRSGSQILEEWSGYLRYRTVLLAAFAVMALLIASIGLFGTISYTTAQRTREIGIRLALGAQRRSVFSLVILQGAKLALIGLAIGIVAALALTRLMVSLVYGVVPSDPFTFITVTLLLALVALLACYIPARRATRVDPMVALRYE